MPDFRFYLLDGTQRITSRRDLVCADDAGAKAAALALLAQNAYARSVEVWQGARLVFKTGADPGIRN